MMNRTNERGASAIEYAGLIVLAALIVGALFVIIPSPVSAHVKSALCTILHLGSGADCTQPPAARKCTAFCPGPGRPIHPSDPVTAATKGNYAALGDSYASGEGSNGTRGDRQNPYINDKRGNSGNDGCHRSSNAATQGLQKQYTFKGGSSFVACSGATSDQVRNGNGGGHGEPAQIGKANPNLNQHTSTVTITVGGDDLHFADVVTACVENPHIIVDRCTQKRGQIQKDMNELFRPRPEYGGHSKYQQLLLDIHKQAPNARILVSGYPHLFPEPPKKNDLAITKSDQEFLNGEARKLDNQISQQVGRLDQQVYGGRQKMGSFEYVDDWDALKGHEETTDHPWINGVSICLRHDPVNPNCPGLGGATSSFHPNTEGQASFQRNLARQLQNGPGRVLYDP